MLSDIVVSMFKNYYFIDVFDFWIVQCFIDVFFQGDGVVVVNIFVGSDY